MLGTTAAVEGGGAGACCGAVGGADCSCIGFDGCPSTPDEGPGGTRFWLPPIEPGGRGGDDSKPDGSWACAGAWAIAAAIATAASSRRPVRSRADREALITPWFTAG